MRATVAAALLALQGCAYSLVVTAEVVSEAPMQVALLDAPGFTEDYGRQGL